MEGFSVTQNKIVNTRILILQFKQINIQIYFKLAKNELKQ